VVTGVLTAVCLLVGAWVAGRFVGGLLVAALRIGGLTWIVWTDRREPVRLRQALAFAFWADNSVCPGDGIARHGKIRARRSRFGLWRSIKEGDA